MRTTPAEICSAQQLALLVYDMQIGIARQIKGSEAVVANIARVLMAARDVFHVKPEGMFYVGLKGEIVNVGWSDTGLLGSEGLPENWLASTRARALQLVERIREGRVEAAPADLSICVYCDFRDVCRVESAQTSRDHQGAV